MKAGAGGAAAASVMALTGRHALAQGGTPPIDNMRFLINRATNGFSLAEYDYALGLDPDPDVAYDMWLEEQLDPDGLVGEDWQAWEDTQFCRFVDIDPPNGVFVNTGLHCIAQMTPTEIVDAYAPGTYPPFFYTLMRSYRAIFTRRQLEDRMIQFWMDHFNIDAEASAQWYLLIPFYRDIIRPNALGNFKDLVVAMSKSSAMLSYLNNDVNVAGAPNENFAREVMELHTMGVDCGYVDTPANPGGTSDIKELAKLLTGWTWETKHSSGSLGEFIADFDPVTGTHDPSTVPLWSGFGYSRNYTADTTLTDGEDALRTMAGTACTALNIATKLVRHFLTDSIDDPQVFANVIVPVGIKFRQSKGDIKDTLRELFKRSRIASVDPWNKPKFRDPFHYLTGAARALQIPRPATLEFDYGVLNVRYLRALGEVPQNWPAPDGPPDGPSDWADGLLQRAIYAYNLTDNMITGLSTSNSVLGPLLGSQLSELAQRFNLVLTGGSLDADDVTEAQAFVANNGYSGPAIRRMIALLLTSASYQQMRG
jgi:uncharacterized protein (DUF1800 family)